MEHTALLYFVGPAGAGKSTLVATLQEWMQYQRYDGVAVNLDPGYWLLKISEIQGRMDSGPKYAPEDEEPSVYDEIPEDIWSR